MRPWRSLVHTLGLQFDALVSTRVCYCYWPTMQWVGGHLTPLRGVPAAASHSLSTQAPGWRHLDVRPAYERERAHVEGSLHVPLFVEDESSDPVSLVKKAVTFGYGGWWMGNKLTRRNNQFMEQAAEALVRRPPQVLPDARACL